MIRADIGVFQLRFKKRMLVACCIKSERGQFRAGVTSRQNEAVLLDHCRPRGQLIQSILVQLLQLPTKLARHDVNQTFPACICMSVGLSWHMVPRNHGDEVDLNQYSKLKPSL